ncbi:MAG: hypothetical protein GXO60_01385 [Epsilonproteobacteria bacterium]|nr:hypothetical protein [Campylobacterota bacterium]
MKISLSLATLVMFFLTACETGYKGDINNSIEDNSTFSYKHKPKASYIPTYEEPLEEDFTDEGFSGGVESDGLDIGTIRTSETDNSVRLVFDSYQWNDTSEYLGDKVEKVGSYSFDYDPEKLLITGVVNGYRGFSAQLPKFSKKSIVEKIYFDKDLDDSGYKFYIKLRYDSKVKVFDLANPGRIVVDITLL